MPVARAASAALPPRRSSTRGSDSGLTISQNFARSLDGRVRCDRQYLARLSARKAATLERVEAMVETACRRVGAGVTERAPDTLHRLDKVDAAEGLDSVRRAADFHVPYAVLLYERLLGRPFASHRDSVSELIGDVMESAVEAEPLARGVSFRKTKRAERVPGFDQAPDFIAPDEYAPAVAGTISQTRVTAKQNAHGLCVDLTQQACCEDLGRQPGVRAPGACSSADEPLLDLREELARVAEVTDLAPVAALWVDALLVRLEGGADRLALRDGLGQEGDLGIGGRLALGLDRCAALRRAHGCLLGYLLAIA